jgi:hypothetical protein
VAFLRLVRHFLARLVSGGQGANGEFALGAGALLGLLAAPGAFQSLLMLDKYSTLLNLLRGRLHQDLLVVSAPDKYQFLCLAMAVTGIVTVLKWDKILPDAQDYLNLSPLPVAPRTILLANAAAIGFAVLVFAIDVNGASAVLFPLFVTAAQQTSLGAFLDFAAIHACCMILASLFTFCAVFASLGLLAAVLPREAFRAISSWVRGGLLIAFVMLLPSGNAAPALLRRLALDPHAAARWLPSFWFLGLYQTWQHRASPVMARLAAWALPASAAVFGLMLACYALSYRRRFAAVMEGGRTPSAQRLSALMLAFLDLFAPRSGGFERAGYRFVTRALLRGESHRVCLAVALGLGWLLAFQSATEKPLGAAPGVAQLASPLIAVYLLVLGLRVAFEIPAGVPANWIFRVTLDSRCQAALPVARRITLAWVSLGVLLPGAAAWWWLWGWRAALAITFYVLALALSLIEVLLAGYRKVPLTSPIPGFRDNFLMLCLFQVLGFAFFTRAGAGLEAWMLDQPPRLLLVPAGMMAAWFWDQRHLRDAREAGEVEEGVTFESLRPPVVERLNLTGG